MQPTDPRIAALYDQDNPDGPDHDHWRRVADRVAPETVIDLGCGTGILTVTLAAEDRSVIGIDPDCGMLDVARQRHGTTGVTWVEGDSQAISPASADLVLMTGNVAQHITADDWQRTLRDIARGLRPDGLLSFETRNPAAEAWRSWQAEDEKHTRHTTQGPMTEWMEITDPDEHGTVVMTAHNLFVQTGEQITTTQPLVFRTLPKLTGDLRNAGLTVGAVHGGWQHEELEATSPLFIVEATKPS